jgi:RNA polymerase sigma factor (sigma-70 family)
MSESTDSSAAQRGRQSVQVGTSFEERVVDVYRLLNYRVEHGRIFSGRQVDLFLEGQFGDLKLQRAIECKTGVVNADDIDSFVAKMVLVRRDYPSAQGTLVATGGFTDAVTSHANAAGIGLVVFRDLEATLFDSHSYASRLRVELTSEARYDSSVYVEPLIGNDTQDAGVNAFSFIDDWLTDGNWNQLTLLGDVGTGKSFFCRMFARRQMSSFNEKPSEAPLPVLVDLRNTDRLLSLEGLILTHFASYGVPHVSFAAFQHLLETGRIVLILDGFDEMAARVSRNVTARNFHELTKAIRGRAKVVLTCRTHYFRSRTEEEEVILGQRNDYGSDAARDLYWDLISRKGFRIAYLRPFTWAQVEVYVSRVAREKSKDILAKIRATYNLTELSQRPMLLEMIVKSLDRLGSGDVNVSTLYQVFTDAWIHRDSWRDILTPESKQDFVTALAKGLWKSGLETLHHSDLATHVKAELAHYIHTPQHFVEVDSEVRTATFLTRDDGGQYGFAHKSYGEFFIARNIAKGLFNGDLECLSGRRLSPEIVEFLRWILNDQAEHLLESAVTGAYRPGISENSLLCLYQVRRSRVVSIARSSMTSGTQLRVELPDNMSMTGAQLEGAVLEGAVMQNIDFTGASLQDAVLVHADLTGAKLVGAKLDKAQLTSAVLIRANLSNATCRATQFADANITSADLRNADLREAFLQVSASLDSRFDGAELAGATLEATLDAQLGLFGPIERPPVSADSDDERFWIPLIELLPRLRRAASIRSFVGGLEAEDAVSQVIVQLTEPRFQRRFIESDRHQRWTLARNALTRVYQTEFQRWLRTHRTEQLRDEPDADEEIEFDVIASIAGAADSTGYERVMLDEMRRQLSERAWTLLYGRFVEGYTISELSGKTGIPPSDVSRQLAKCTDLLLDWARSSRRDEA